MIKFFCGSQEQSTGNVTVSAISRIPLRYMFWAILYSFIINLLDETMMNGGFVEGMRTHFWAGFSSDKFFFMNGLFIFFITLSILIYERRGGRWVMFPLFWAMERTFNGFWHVSWTFAFLSYSPGLVTSGLFWIITYLLIKENYGQGDFTKRQLLTATGAALIFETLFLGTILVIPLLGV